MKEQQIVWQAGLLRESEKNGILRNYDIIDSLMCWGDPILFSPPPSNK